MINIDELNKSKIYVEKEIEKLEEELNKRKTYIKSVNKKIELTNKMNYELSELTNELKIEVIDNEEKEV